MIHVSTSEVYGTAKYVPMDENHPTLPHSTYAVSKLAADRAAFAMHKEHGYPLVIMRPFNSYGPNVTQPYIVPEIALQLLNGRNPIALGNVNAVRDFTYVADTARAIILASIEKRAAGATINIGSGRGIRISDLAALMAKILDKELEIHVDESRFRPYDVEELVCDFGRAEELLKWRPTISLQEGLEKTLNWLKKYPVRYGSPFTGWPRVYGNSSR